jgi:hypothetical protein
MRSQACSSAIFENYHRRFYLSCEPGHLEVPPDQHLFPIFSDSARGVTIYRASAADCNSCKSKAACTDSNHGREIERRDLGSVEYGMKRFHHAISITLLVLATLILGVESIRESVLFLRLILIAVLTLFYLIVQRLFSRLSSAVPDTGQDLSR